MSRPEGAAPGEPSKFVQIAFQSGEILHLYKHGITNYEEWTGMEKVEAKEMAETWDTILQLRIEIGNRLAS